MFRWDKVWGADERGAGAGEPEHVQQLLLQDQSKHAGSVLETKDEEFSQLLTWTKNKPCYLNFKLIKWGLKAHNDLFFITSG